MVLRKILLRLLGVITLLCLQIPAAAAAAPTSQNGISLIEPIGPIDNIPTEGMGPLGPFGYYLGLLYPWAVGMGAATAVLMGLVGGIQMMTAGGDQGKRQAGVNRLMMSLGGLLLVLFSATILHTLNPTFYK